MAFLSIGRSFHLRILVPTIPSRSIGFVEESSDYVPLTLGGIFNSSLSLEVDF
jgi:hypothetical protein